MASSLEIRDDLARVLQLDLIGPRPGDARYEQEQLDIAPSRFYLAGFLVPHEADEDWKSARDGQESVGTEEGDGSGDDERAEEKASARKVFFPSSMGLSVCVGAETKTLEVTATWGEYEPLDAETKEKKEEGRWKRVAHSVTKLVTLKNGSSSVELDSRGVRLAVVVRALKLAPAIAKDAGLSGVRAVSLFLVNDRKPDTTRQRDQFFLFQTELKASCKDGFAPRPDLRGLHARKTDVDEAIADLQYRNAPEFVVGHGLGTRATLVDGSCREVSTTWIPGAEVHKVDAARLAGDFDMKGLASAANGAELAARLSPLTAAYRAWIQQQRGTPGLSSERQIINKDLLDAAELACRRIDDGLALLDQPKVFRAFTLANAAMESQARQRNVQRGDTTAVPTWRPFQLAFVLMNLRGIVDPKHVDREVVDLLFFPTGGGKTEAYLGLAAFTLLFRRLTNEGLSSAGVSVLMRYTLRLLTLDQLQRAATLVCALELQREGLTKELGEWPFEIGLWVGRAATPNRLGKVGEQDENTARSRVLAYQKDTRRPLPIPLENCPWCGGKFTPASFQLEGNPDEPTDLRIRCANRGECAFAARALPVLTVDDAIYRRLPCFVIATMDKFAALPWEARTGALFGKVDRTDGAGFFGPADPSLGTRRLPTQLLPPDLIIQDELHLISGPLGTVAGLYEAVIEQLSTRKVGDALIRPKLVASTATVRRAQQQIRELFGRKRVEIFPPPGPDRNDSFFARAFPPPQKAARLYLGVSAPGRSLKVVMLRTYLALMGGAHRRYVEAGGDANKTNPADPYMTLLGYFNSLRDLGGSRRIVEDEVVSRLASMEQYRSRVGEATAPDFKNRRIKYDPMELTSRETNAAVARAKTRLGNAFHDVAERVDVAIATNMISVGLDITRLGLMVVLSQPKTTAEYIQATSRVGRDDQRPGLVVTLLNAHKPRDRSHLERFEHFHRTFYRSVEATSVTPFSPRAIDRALVGVVVGLARQGQAELTAPRSALELRNVRSKVDWVADVLAERAARAGHDDESSNVRARAKKVLDYWEQIAADQASTNSGLQYQREQGNDPALLHTPLDPALASLVEPRNRFKANRSLRDVEPNVNLFIRRLTGDGEGPELPES